MAGLAADRRIRWLFVVAALWNLSAAGIALAFPAYNLESFFGAGAELSGAAAALNTQAFWISVLFFGVGYAIVARDPSKNHGLILIGALGKTAVFVIWFSAWLAGDMTRFALAGAIGDLAFAAVFLWFLWRARRSA